jgi:uncharacterized protein YegP (UPF0339 family)
MSIQLFQSSENGQWYFRLVARNGKTIAASEGYRRKAGARKTIKRYWPEVRVKEVTSS